MSASTAHDTNVWVGGGMYEAHAPGTLINHTIVVGAHAEHQPDWQLAQPLDLPLEGSFVVGLTIGSYDDARLLARHNKRLLHHGRDLIGDALRGLGQWRAILRCSQPGANRRHLARPAFAGDDQRRAVRGVDRIEFGARPDGLRERSNVLDVLQQLLPTRRLDHFEVTRRVLGQLLAIGEAHAAAVRVGVGIRARVRVRVRVRVSCLLSTIQKRIGKLLADATARCARPRGKECFSISAATGALAFACSTGALAFAFSTGALVFAFSMSWNRRSTSSTPKSAFTSGAVAYGPTAERANGTAAEQCFVAVGTKPAERVKTQCSMLCARRACVRRSWWIGRVAFVERGIREGLGFGGVRNKTGGGVSRSGGPASLHVSRALNHHLRTPGS
eukprot:scaffold41222_cov63-Phaeocystis_antarctica.AAC.4